MHVSTALLEDVSTDVIISETIWLSRCLDISPIHPQKNDGLDTAIAENIRNVDCVILNSLFENTILLIKKYLQISGNILNNACNYVVIENNLNCSSAENLFGEFKKVNSLLHLTIVLLFYKEFRARCEFLE